MAEPARQMPQAGSTEKPSLESLFAVETPEPLADAFPGKRAVHPFIGMRRVAEADVPGL